MKKFLIFFVISFFAMACVDNTAKHLKEMFDRNVYDTAVINKMYLYDSIKNIALRNIDTIFKYKDARNYISYTDEKGKTGKRNESSDYYRFYKNYNVGRGRSRFDVSDFKSQVDNDDLENLPKYIFAQLDSLFGRIGPNNIEGFELRNDSSVEIMVRSFYNKEIESDGYDGFHTLSWKSNFPQDDESDLLVKDTVIIPRWVYRILVQVHQDH